MTRNKKKFDKYQKFILEHENYQFIESHKDTWVKTSKGGKNPRKLYWNNKLKELKDVGMNVNSLSDVAFYIHPTKVKKCQCCEKYHNIAYVYPNKKTLKWLQKTFTYNTDLTEDTETIFDIYDKIDNNNKEFEFKKYFKFKNTLEEFKNLCFSYGIKSSKLSPGVMSNVPDRFDGYHSYNRCCRKKNDKGRHDNNMKSYTRDRRCYNYYSDGNNLLANLLMGKLNNIENKCFICKKNKNMTGDHIGPISLGFIHDPINLQACCSSCNSTKGNRLKDDDKKKLLDLEEQGKIIISWWAKPIWDKYKNKKSCRIINQKLNINTLNFLSIMQYLLKNKRVIIEKFLLDCYNTKCISYKMDNIIIDENGNIQFTSSGEISTKKTKKTQQQRIFEILLDDFKDEKNNRKLKKYLINKTKIKEECDEITIENFKITVCKILQM